jgi:diguanylate cyclase (GGDEF)-like protein
LSLNGQSSEPVTQLLLLEDNPADRALAHVYLEEIADQNFEICEVGLVADARARLEATPHDFDIVFVDHNLPDGNGLDLIRELSGRISAPMILLTGNSNRDIDVAAMASGASDFLPKDIINSQVLDRAIRYSISERKNSLLLKKNVVQLEATNEQLVSDSKRIEAEVANVIKLAEHLAKPSDQLDVNCHILDTDRSSYESVSEASNVGVWRIQADGLTLHANSHICRLLKIESAELLEGRSFVSQFAARDRERAEREMAVWKSGMTSSFESQFAPLGDAQGRDLAISGCPVLDAEGGVDSIIITVVDVTERRRSETTIREMAQTDPLTSLLNRTTFMDMLPSLVAINRRNGTSVALLYIDLDGFKAVNDTYGHQAGDDVLKVVAGKLQACIRESDFVARIGGDEFTVVLNNLHSPLGAASVAENILTTIRKPWKIDDQVVDIGVSIGIAIFDTEECTPPRCLKNADLALYRCKQEGGNGYRFFDQKMLEAVAVRHKFEADLAIAPETGAFRLHYQPQVSLLDGAVTGMEALLRWEKPDVGLVGPTDFMDIAEESGAIIQIGQWVTKTACRQIANLPSDIPISINVSAKELHQPDLIKNLAAAVRECDIQPGRLMIEVTESAVIDDLEQSARVISEIRHSGIKVALDDFGTGYSSLSILKSLRVDSLKIDGSFIRNICADTVDAAITESVIDLGRRMGLRVVAECIETAEQATLLKQLGCTEAQGFHYCKPMPADHFWVTESAVVVQSAGMGT